MDFRRWIGGEDKIYDYCHNLAIRGGKLLAEMFDTRLLDPTGEQTATMVRLPPFVLFQGPWFTLNLPGQR